MNNNSFISQGAALRNLHQVYSNPNFGSLNTVEARSHTIGSWDTVSALYPPEIEQCNESERALYCCSWKSVFHTASAC